MCVCVCVFLVLSWFFCTTQMFGFDLPYYDKLYYHLLLFHLLCSDIMYLNNSQIFVLSLKYSDLGSKIFMYLGIDQEYWHNMIYSIISLCIISYGLVFNYFIAQLFYAPLIEIHMRVSWIIVVTCCIKWEIIFRNIPM